MPTLDLVDRIKLMRMPCAPQRDRRTLVQHPPNGEREHRLVEARPRKRFKFSDGLEILRKARLLEFRIDLAKIVSLKLCLCRHPAGQQPTAQRAITQDGKAGTLRIGKHVRFDLALEKIVWRLDGIERRAFAEGIQLCR